MKITKLQCMILNSTSTISRYLLDIYYLKNERKLFCKQYYLSVMIHTSH